MPKGPTPRVSVILCAYNAQRYLGATIASVLAQTWTDFELIVIDDGSSDGTRGIVEACARRDARVVYHHQANAGFGAARNKALSLARADWIAIIDHDDLCLPDRLAVELAAARAHPQAGLIFSDSEHFQDDGKVLRRQFESYDPSGRELAPGQAAELLLLHGCFVDSETAFFRKSLALEVGGFPTEYRYINDYAFFLKAGLKTSFFGVDRVLARWRVHAGQLTRTARQTMLREHLLVYRQWLEHPALSLEARRALKMRVFGNLAKAARYPALRSELGGLPGLAAGLWGSAPSSRGDYLWCARRAWGKLSGR